MADRAQALEPAAPPACAVPALERRLIDRYQHDFPPTARPYRAIAKHLGTTEMRVIEALRRLLRRGVLSRVGAVVAPHRIGWSTLAAMEVPPERLSTVAAMVAGYGDVNHVYQRDHSFNLWFVVTAADRGRVDSVISRIAQRTSLAVLDLPIEVAYHIDLGFPIQWS
jgi:DNA-binding Lrp family transcriptional regulator